MRGYTYSVSVYAFFVFNQPFERMQNILPLRSNAGGRCFSLAFLLFFLAQGVFAQRTFFNVPMMETEGADEILFQQQFTVTDEVEAGSTFTYGLAHRWEVGLNLSHLTLHYPLHARFLELQSSEAEKNPHLTLNLHKGVRLTDWWLASVGTRPGITYEGAWEKTQFVHFTYLGTQLNIPGTEGKLVGGGYYTNPAYVGKGNQVGYMVAIQVPIWSDKLVFEGEYISGTTQYSNWALGLGLQLGPKWQLAAGGQIPAPGSGNPYGATIQLTRQ